MSVRPSAVAGAFYPGSPAQLRQMLEEFLPPAERVPALAVVSPHAGYVYSGGTAGAVFARVEVPRDVVILALNHRGAGAEFSLWPAGKWETPLGQVEVAGDLVDAIREGCGAKVDENGHLGEHSAEVQVPFLQMVREDVRIAPVSFALGLESFDRLCDFGRRLAKIDREFLVVVSTDLNHFDPHEVTREKDRHAIEAIAKLDGKALKEALEKHAISMCGCAPTIAMIAFAKERGATEAKLIQYRTSGEVGGDMGQTVGYAGMIVEKPECGS
ncbi:MAG: AmmeMemoRadiSam system protein B [Planctomycetota bacterium]|jgi:AmmeMemoRadiSam system protein B